MKCGCIKTVTENVRKSLEDRPELTGKITSVECNAVGIAIIGNSLLTTINIPFAIKADAPGFRSNKGKSMSMIASYCPFCGVSTKEEKPAA